MSREVLDEIQKLASDLSWADQAELLERLAHQLRTAPPSPRAPMSLRGIWKGKFPEDVDIDAILNEAQHEWEKEWTEDGEFTEGTGDGDSRREPIWLGLGPPRR